MRIALLSLAATGMLWAVATASRAEDEPLPAKSETAEGVEAAKEEIEAEADADVKKALKELEASPPAGKKSVLDGAETAKKAQENRWRFRWYNNQWWYWTTNNKWVIWDGKAWVPFTGQVLSDRGNFGGGYYGNTYYDPRYRGQGGYYGNQYYGGGSGYYGNTYYGNGGYYPNNYRPYGAVRSPYSSGYRGSTGVNPPNTATGARAVAPNSAAAPSGPAPTGNRPGGVFRPERATSGSGNP